MKNLIKKILKEEVPNSIIKRLDKTLSKLNYEHSSIRYVLDDGGEIYDVEKYEFDNVNCGDEWTNGEPIQHAETRLYLDYPDGSNIEITHNKCFPTESFHMEAGGEAAMLDYGIAQRLVTYLELLPMDISTKWLMEKFWI